ncbi:MAG: 4,5-DOPA dioxygenase extradiol [Anaerolineaceae bacterium]|nr:4,5-DOPA dioxygenase extradiol [Anaerolineaceae bacterium]
MSNKRMPVLFVGHGSPMNAIEDNEFSRGWHEVVKSFTRPRAILCVSAHWETWGTLVTGMEKPKTIHDFGGFPPELYAARYPAPGSPWLANEVKKMVCSVEVSLDADWGLDHGCWSALKKMYPDADIPVAQLSLDYTQQGIAHYNLAKELAPLRDQGVLILGSGNMVHNLRRVVIPDGGFSNFNQPFALEWAKEADAIFKNLINLGRFEELADYHSLGEAVQLAVPTPEHYFPMLYALGLKTEKETITYFNDKPLAGSLTMTSLLIQ